MKKLLYSALAAGLVSVALLALGGCSTTYPRRNPTGEVLPQVTGKALDGTEVTLPDVGKGAPLLLLVGYEQNAQFDLDRWLIGLTMAKVQVKAFEVPTIPGMIPGMIAGTIDAGMRRGIPEEDWGSVVTLYDEAKTMAEFTGNEDGMTGRILVLDGEGKVVFFHDRGFSVGTLQKVQEAIARM